MIFRPKQNISYETPLIPATTVIDISPLGEDTVARFDQRSGVVSFPICPIAIIVGSGSNADQFHKGINVTIRKKTNPIRMGGGNEFLRFVLIALKVSSTQGMRHYRIQCITGISHGFFTLLATCLSYKFYGVLNSHYECWYHVGSISHNC